MVQLLLPLFKSLPAPKAELVDVSPLLLDKDGKSAHGGLLGLLMRRYENQGVSREDLMQAGLMGLVKAAKRFDPKRGIKFITYGKFAARREMGRLFERHRRWDKRHLLDAGGVDEEGSPLQNFIEAQPDDVPDPSVSAERKDLIEAARQRMKALSRRELGYVYLHFWSEMSYADIARAQGVSRTYVRKVVTNAVKKLRASMQEAGDL